MNMRENSGNPRSEERTAAPFFSQTAMGDFESCKLASALHAFPTSGKNQALHHAIHPPGQSSPAHISCYCSRNEPAFHPHLTVMQFASIHTSAAF